ncbi:hypothetical protein GCM10028833_31090 [Glycomyces tarimensis]
MVEIAAFAEPVRTVGVEQSLPGRLVLGVHEVLEPADPGRQALKRQAQLGSFERRRHGGDVVERPYLAQAGVLQSEVPAVRQRLGAVLQVLGLHAPRTGLGQARLEAGTAHADVPRQKLGAESALADGQAPARREQTGQGVDGALLISGVMEDVPRPDDIGGRTDDGRQALRLADIGHCRLDRDTGLLGTLTRQVDHRCLGVDGDHPRHWVGLGERQRHTGRAAADIDHDRVLGPRDPLGRAPVLVDMGGGVPAEAVDLLPEIDRGLVIRGRSVCHEAEPTIRQTRSGQ